MYDSNNVNRKEAENRERLIDICRSLVVGCKENLCADCEYKGTEYPACRALYFADRLIESGVSFTTSDS